MFSKRRLINALFILGFPFYGMGVYVQQSVNYTLGNIWSIAPFLAVILLHLLDLVYRPKAYRVLNRDFALGAVYLLTLVWSQFVAYMDGFPGINTVNLIGTILVYIVPFHAAVVVVARNRDIPSFDLSNMVLIGLVLLVLINLGGYAIGFRNAVHGFEGRMNLPFLRGIYDGAHILAIINLMLLFHLKDPLKRPLRFTLLLALFAVNLVITMSINSRLSFMIFLIIAMLFITRAIRGARFIYTLSLFTLPILMSFSLLIYQILSLPVFERVLQRVDKADVVTFNGRTFIWTAAGDWFMNDRRGLLFGNGYQGHYQLGLLDFVGVLWDEENTYNLHMHSTFLQVLLGQGLLGVLLLYAIYWRIYKFYRERYLSDGPERPMFAVVVYLLFIWQMDFFCFGQGSGAMLTMCAMALLAVDRTRGIGASTPEMERLPG